MDRGCSSKHLYNVGNTFGSSFSADTSFLVWLWDQLWDRQVDSQCVTSVQHHLYDHTGVVTNAMINRSAEALVELISEQDLQRRATFPENVDIRLALTNSAERYHSPMALSGPSLHTWPAE